MRRGYSGWWLDGSNITQQYFTEMTGNVLGPHIWSEFPKLNFEHCTSELNWWHSPVLGVTLVKTISHEDSFKSFWSDRLFLPSQIKFWKNVATNHGHDCWSSESHHCSLSNAWGLQKNYRNSHHFVNVCVCVCVCVVKMRSYFLPNLSISCKLW